MRNASGEWVAPSPESITKAIAASGEPLHTLTNKVSGAYPLTWVERIYVKASGLSIDKTNAVATFIRYVVTEGQSVNATVNDGRLSDALVREALDAADAVVKGNCQGTDRLAVKGSDLVPAATGNRSW